MLVETLIEKAAKNLGSQAAVARELGVHRAQITNWKNGTDKCQPADLAAIAYLAGYSALNVLAAATLKEYEGTQKGAVLNAALGKEIPALGCLNASGSTTIKDETDNNTMWRYVDKKEIRDMQRKCVFTEKTACRQKSREARQIYTAGRCPRPCGLTQQPV